MVPKKLSLFKWEVLKSRNRKQDCVFLKTQCWADDFYLVSKNIRKITIFVRGYQIQHKKSKIPSEILLFDGFGQV
jgi:hypothetical protein